MMDNNQIAKTVEGIAKSRPHIACAYLFGSALAKVPKGVLSDIDIAIVVWPYDKYAAADVALSFPEKFDVTVLNEARPDVIVEVLRSGRLIYAGDRERMRMGLRDIKSRIRENLPLLEKAGVI